VQSGRGLRIINELTKGLDGSFEQSLGSQGSTFVVAFPSSRNCTALSPEDTRAGMEDIAAQSLDESTRDGLLSADT
jgi:hypothetical protein